jgi:hypothetical protein
MYQNRLKGKIMTNKYKVLLLCLMSSIALTSQSMAAKLQEEAGPVNPYNPFPKNKVMVTKVKHFGVVCWKIATAGGNFYFENGNETGGSTGFNSALDRAGEFLWQFGNNSIRALLPLLSSGDGFLTRIPVRS